MDGGNRRNLGTFRGIAVRLVLFCLACMVPAVRSADTPAPAGSAVAPAEQARRHFVGDGVTQDYTEALRLYRLAAEQGDPEGQNGVGACYAKGAGVGRDDREAAKWFRLAAEQGFAKAQLNIADCYWDGLGVDPDCVRALMWAALAAAGGGRDGLAVARRYADRMRASEVFCARMAAREWIKARRLTLDVPDLPSGSFGRLVGTGSGFFVSRDGTFITSRHVLAGGNAVWVRTRNGILPAALLREDATSDLALFAVNAEVQALSLADSDAVQLGQTVFTVGFPNVDVQGFAPKMTRGEVSSLAGIRDDPRTFQVSVPVQPGNSGGPLADASGNVIGVVCSQLSKSAMTDRNRPAPENVNYAIKIGEAKALLRSVPGVSWKATGHRAGASGEESLTGAVREVEAATALIVVYRE